MSDTIHDPSDRNDTHTTLRAAVERMLSEMADVDLPPDVVSAITTGLAGAAAAWHAAVGDDGLGYHDGTYYGSSNRFVWLAERASLAALGLIPPPVAREKEPRPPRDGCYLYRLWQDDGRLLYVGVSTRLRARLLDHRRRWPGLWVSATWEQYPDEASMLAAEKVAIVDEAPALNRAGIYSETAVAS